MRLRIDTAGIQFRVASAAVPRMESRDSKIQKKTPDGRPVWTVRLDAIDTERQTKETIWVEVTGEEPKLVFDGFAQVHGLAFAPWVNRKGELVRAFRADAVTALADARRQSAA